MLFMSIPMPIERSGVDQYVLDNCIRQMARGDQEGLATLYELTHSAVYGFALSIVKNVDDAQDICQDTFIQLFYSANRYQSQQKPMAWILTITRNLALNRLKEQKRSEPLDAMNLELPAEQLEVSVEDRIVLKTMLEQLGNEECQIVILHAVTGLKHREIAALLQLSLSTVLSKYNRAIKKLQKAWKEVQ
ncbi:MAG: RNA polymerase sigma factor [Lachnospiraceae bacterium]